MTQRLSAPTSGGARRRVPSVKLHERELTEIRAARDEAGPDAALMLDVNCPWTLTQARERADGSANPPGWLEEPLWPPEDYEGLARLRRTAASRRRRRERGDAAGLRPALAAGAVDFVQPSPAKMGGVTELCKVFQLATARGVTVMPHTFYHGPGLLAAMQVTAALGRRLDDRMAPLRPRGADIRGRAHPAGGRIPVPQGPGLGIDPDPDVLRAFAADQGR